MSGLLDNLIMDLLDVLKVVDIVTNESFNQINNLINTNIQNKKEDYISEILTEKSSIISYYKFLNYLKEVEFTRFIYNRLLYQIDSEIRFFDLRYKNLPLLCKYYPSNNYDITLKTTIMKTNFYYQDPNDIINLTYRYLNDLSNISNDLKLDLDIIIKRESTDDINNNLIGNQCKKIQTKYLFFKSYSEKIRLLKSLLLRTTFIDKYINYYILIGSNTFKSDNSTKNNNKIYKEYTELYKEFKDFYKYKQYHNKFSKIQNDFGIEINTSQYFYIIKTEYLSNHLDSKISLGDWHKFYCDEYVIDRVKINKIDDFDYNSNDSLSFATHQLKNKIFEEEELMSKSFYLLRSLRDEKFFLDGKDPNRIYCDENSKILSKLYSKDENFLKYLEKIEDRYVNNEERQQVLTLKELYFPNENKTMIQILEEKNFNNAYIFNEDSIVFHDNEFYEIIGNKNRDPHLLDEYKEEILMTEEIIEYIATENINNNN